jgi:hypothetical protein
LGLLLPKLTVGQIDDPLEHEADRVADQVMRMPAPVSLPCPGETEVLRRKCESCTEEEQLARCSTPAATRTRM